MSAMRNIFPEASMEVRWCISEGTMRGEAVKEIVHSSVIHVPHGGGFGQIGAEEHISGLPLLKGAKVA